ncbi:Signal transduction histidine kinase [Flavobacterium succinicans]|uniref:Signal transduction histidine kinase n=2 Tax=Flavobacterium succinicans TaxID=29536 RepID=A0A1I4W3V5_9FLAO|nr:ATP-binding protein [Flavobacterium succinicans]SFN08364.1 Signal transduction histidine kinase [Flavobacterium succinicans]
MQNPLSFKVSSALKNIIGSDLINDDFIAVFELVKNAYDAHATKVEIIFENIYSSRAKIIIKDNGKGMNYDDLINKWLFVAYSAKIEGTEEDSYDYRDKIKVKRAYAGAKGIGRFSCDRLGSNLYLETIKDETNPKVEVLITDWNKFEGDIKDEFVNITVLQETIEESNYDIEHGTVLEITNLKSKWNRDKFLQLKDALSRLINPNTINENDSFNILLKVKEELENDKEQILKNKKQVNHPKSPIDQSLVKYIKIVNGDIQNLIFDTLGIKTTYIESKVYDSEIITTLFEAGKMVYSVTEENPFENFKDLNFSIYYLNLSAKLTFSRRMGLQPVEYGHIFVYKNGLRIFPYGERGNDPLKMDNRKAQGHSRYLGTREVIGYISIEGTNNNLRETSSRGDGLIKTQTYLDLENWFYETLKKLEKYTIEITDWGNSLSPEEFINFDNVFIKNKGQENEKINDINDNLRKLLNGLTNSKNVIRFEVSDEILSILNKKSENSINTVLSNLTEQIKTDSFNKEEVISTIKKAEKKIDELRKVKDEAEAEAFEKLIENEKISKELNEEISRKLFDNSINNRDKDDLLTLQHQIVHTAGNITFSLDELIKSINSNLSKDKLIEEVLNINLEVKKILSASRFVTNAGFSMESERITEDIVQFSYDYVVNNYIPINSFIHQKRPINIEFEPIENIGYKTKFRPLEITVLFDNLFSNSKKANSKNIFINWTKTKSDLILYFKDDGDGIPNEIKDKVFDFGYTKTNGSGIGLYQTKETLRKLGASITINNDFKKGVEFIITFPL